MADLIKKVRFERPSIPQSAPLGKAVLTLVEPDFTQFVAGFDQQRRASFRAGDLQVLSSEHLTQPQIPWSVFIPVPPDISQTIPPILQQRESFRAHDAGLLKTDHLTQPSFSWLKDVLLLLPLATIEQRSPAIEQLLRSFVFSAKPKIFTGYLPQRSIAVLLFEPSKLGQIWSQQAGSFRVHSGVTFHPGLLAQADIGWFVSNLTFFEIAELAGVLGQQYASFRVVGTKVLEAQYHLTEPELSWLRDTLELLDPPRLQAIFDAQGGSFRVEEAEKLLGVHLTQPQFSWLQSAFNLFAEAIRQPAYDQLLTSFRAISEQKYKAQFYDKAKELFAVLVRDISSVQPPVDQLLGSFIVKNDPRTRSTLQLTEGPNGAWLKAILDLVESTRTPRHFVQMIKQKRRGRRR